MSSVCTAASFLEDWEIEKLLRRAESTYECHCEFDGAYVPRVQRSHIRVGAACHAYFFRNMRLPPWCHLVDGMDSEIQLFVRQRVRSQERDHATPLPAGVTQQTKRKIREDASEVIENILHAPFNCKAPKRTPPAEQAASTRIDLTADDFLSSSSSSSSSSEDVNSDSDSSGKYDAIVTPLCGSPRTPAEGEESEIASV